MKKICLLLIVQIAVFTAFAQNPQNPKDKKDPREITVKIKNAPGNTYLFDIMQGPLPLGLAMQNNPATMLRKGFASREDATKVAEWMIEQYKKDGHLPAVVPPHVLDKLKIDKEKLYHN